MGSLRQLSTPNVFVCLQACNSFVEIAAALALWTGLTVRAVLEPGAVTAVGRQVRISVDRGRSRSPAKSKSPGGGCWVTGIADRHGATVFPLQLLLTKSKALTSIRALLCTWFVVVTEIGR